MRSKRARFATDIVAEVFEPRKTSNKVVVFAPGMPGMPGTKNKLARFFNKKGYWFIYPRYRGTWESGGYFLEEEPTKDILDVIEGVQTPFQSLPEGPMMHITDPEVYVFGSSFGGAAALLSSTETSVKKVLVMSGIVNWLLPGRAEPLDWLYETFMPQVFGAGYRLKTPDVWKKLRGTFYNPIQRNEVSSEKILMLHSDTDITAPYKSAKEYAKKHHITLITLKGLGHASSSNIMKRNVWRKVKKHFEK